MTELLFENSSKMNTDDPSSMQEDALLTEESDVLSGGLLIPTTLYLLSSSR